MRLLRYALVPAVLLMVLTACGEESEDTGISTNVQNDLLAYVPNDTPYVAANLEPTPVEIVDAYLEMAQPVLDTLQANLSKMRAKLTSGSADDHNARVALAVIQEFDGKLSREGLASLGIDINSHKVMYGMEVFPVFRIGLSDPMALHASLDRIQANSGIEMPQSEYQGVKFWRVTEDPQDASPAGFYMAILDSHLAMSVFPPMAEDKLLPAFLGLEMPSDGNASSRLAGLNAEHGYTPYGTGLLDLQKLADLFLDPESIVMQVMAVAAKQGAPELGPVCSTEIRQLVSQTPLMVAGTTELTTSSVAYQYRVEAESSLAQELIQLVADIPAVAPFSERIFEMSFGMRFGRVRDFLRDRVQSVVDAPFQCEHFQELNTSAVAAIAQLNEPLPPFVNNFQGARLSLSDLTMVDGTPQSGSGLLALYVDKPEMFVGMAQMMLPNLAELKLAPGEPPVPLPENLVPLPDTVTYAAMSDSAIGLSVGAGEEAGLQSFLAEDNGPEGTFLSVSYDINTYLEYTNHLGQMQDDVQSQHHDAALEMAEAMQEAFKSVADRSHSTFRFGPEGLIVDGAMTFK